MTVANFARLDKGEMIKMTTFDKAWGVVKNEEEERSMGISIDQVIGILEAHADFEPEAMQVNDDHWTLADLFVRQYLNNGDDGFGMVNVEEMYHFICDNKQLLIDNNMLSDYGRNNSGIPLWDNHDFDRYREVLPKDWADENYMDEESVSE